LKLFDASFAFHLSSYQPSARDWNMSFPNPLQAPEEFLVNLNTLGLYSVSTAFIHYQNRPIQTPGARYDEPSTEQWCERMYMLLVSACQF
jgi:hypothetical protein